MNDFTNKYLLDLNLRNISNSFWDIAVMIEPTYLSGYTSVKTWIKFWEYYSTCDSSKLSKATTNPEFPPDFPPLDYYTLNKVVFHYLLDVGLVEEARTFALHTSDDNPDGIDYVDYTVVQSVRKFIVPFTAYISEYSPNSKAGETFLFPSLIEVRIEFTGSSSIFLFKFNYRLILCPSVCARRFNLLNHTCLLQKKNSEQKTLLYCLLISNFVFILAYFNILGITLTSISFCILKFCHRRM